MGATDILIRYDGHEADGHRIDMRLLGTSLIGVDRTIQEGLWAAANPGVPKGRKKSDVTVQVYAPRPACLEIAALVASVDGQLPYAYDLAVGLGANYIWHLLSALLLRHGGRPKDAAVHVDKMLDLVASQLAASVEDRRLERETAERMQVAYLGTLERLLTGMRKQAQDIAAPIGPSANALILPSRSDMPSTVVDVAMAEAIRSSVPVEVSDMERIVVKFDELDRGNRRARVELVSDPGTPVRAEIRDPAYDTFPNAYSNAFNEGAVIEVSAKLTRRKEDGQLVKIHIMDT